MAYHFNVVTVEIEHEGAVVVRVVVRPRAGRAVVAAAGAERRGVEGIHQRARLDPEGHVQWRAVGRTLGHPEVRLGRHAETGDGGAAGDRGRKLR